LKERAGETFLPIIVLTSLSDSASRIRALKMGADDFLSKPIDRLEVTMRIKNLLALRSKDVALTGRNVALAELNRFKDEMSALLVHDLKGPLSVMLMNCEYVAKQVGGGDPAVIEAIADAKTAGLRVIRLLANLLDIARSEGQVLSLRRANTDLTRLLRDLTNQRRAGARSRAITLSVIAPHPVSVAVDEDLLSRALENILDNALRYTPAEGEIEVTVARSGELASIRVANTGPSIPTESRRLVFEKFGQAASDNVGRMNLGLGLYFCRLALEAHGGTVAIEDNETFPTVFVLTLPGTEQRTA
jgi:signal transduction histidine kinase